MKITVLKRRLACLLLAASAIAWNAPVLAEDAAETVTVSASAVNDGGFLLNERELAVSSAEAESFGYSDSLTGGVSALDVIVKMHEIKYGSAFTPQTSAELLEVSESGWITKTFGSSVPIGYSVNHGSTYSLYTEMTNGSSLEIYFYSDTVYWSDTFYRHIDDFTVTAGEEYTIKAEYDGGDGYVPMSGVKLALVEGLQYEPIEGVYADENGEIHVKFDGPGEYFVTLAGEVSREVVTDWQTGETSLISASVIPSVTRAVVVPGGLDEAYAAVTETMRAKTLSYNSDSAEWAALGLARAGYGVTDTYYRSVMEAIDSGKVKKATDTARTLIVLSAVGRPSAALLQKLSSNRFVNVNGGLYASIYGLIAADASGKEIPEAEDAADQNTREKMINAILAHQVANGGFDAGWGTDVDTAAMAVQALAAYGDRDEVSGGIEKALEYIAADLYKEQEYTPDICSSLAQVVTAYAALGRDPSSYVIKMLEYYDGKGNFMYDGGANSMTTTQAYYALTAYYRWAEGENRLYDMSDVYYAILGNDGGEYTIYAPFETKALAAGVSEDAVKTQTAELKKGENKLTAEGCDKLLLWDSLSGMYPLCEVYSK